MLIVRNYFMKLILLSTITFDIMVACCMQKTSDQEPSDQGPSDQEPSDQKLSVHEIMLKKSVCFDYLKIYCKDAMPNNLICAIEAIFTYREKDNLDKPFVQIFFAKVILPNTKHRVILSPKDFCNIREVGVAGEISAGSSFLGKYIGKGKKIQPQTSQPTADQTYLREIKKEINNPVAAQKCLDDLEEFISYFNDNPDGKKMFEFALLRTARSQYKDPDSFGIKYLEYIARTIYDVEVPNYKTDGPYYYCQYFDYVNMERATELVKSQSTKNHE